MNRPAVRKLSATVEWVVLAAVVSIAISLAVAGVWIFRDAPQAAAPRSIWHAVLSDRATLGFVRLLVVVLALYGLASVAISVIRGRWIRSISTSGIEVDTASEGSLAITILEDKLRRARSQRDEAIRLLEEVRHG